MCLVGILGHALCNEGRSTQTFWERFLYQKDVYLKKKKDVYLLLVDVGVSGWKAEFAAAVFPEGKWFLAFQNWNHWVSWFVKQFTV